MAPLESNDANDQEDGQSEHDEEAVVFFHIFLIDCVPLDYEELANLSLCCATWEDTPPFFPMYKIFFSHSKVLLREDAGGLG